MDRPQPTPRFYEFVAQYRQAPIPIKPDRLLWNRVNGRVRISLIAFASLVLSSCSISQFDERQNVDCSFEPCVAYQQKTNTLYHQQAVAIGEKQNIGQTNAIFPKPGTTLKASEFTSIVLEYTGGKTKISAGGFIRFSMRHVYQWSLPQIADPKAAGFVTVQAPTGVTLEIVPWTTLPSNNEHFLKTFPWQHTIDVRLTSGELLEGQTIKLTFGDKSKGGPGVQVQPFEAIDYPFRTYVSAESGATPLPVSPDVTFDIVGMKATRIVASISNSKTDDRSFLLLVRAEDKFGNQAKDYSEDLSVLTETGEMLANFKSSEFHNGILKATISKPDRDVVRVRVSDGELTATSNPISREKWFGSSKVFWGDIHGHTNLSDGHGSPVDFYTYCRDVVALDLCALTEHDFMLNENLWARSKQVTESFNDPGKFVTLQAFEWSGMTDVGGDHNVYYRSSDPPVYRSRSYYDYRNQQAYHGNDPQINFIEDLYLTLKQEFSAGSVLAIPHFGGRKGNPSWHDPEVERAIELFSDHQRSYEWASGFQSKSYKLGFIASSDNHIGRPGNGFLSNPLIRNGAPFEIGTALVGVIAEDLSRESIFDALYNRRVYATSGERILLSVTMGDAQMGADLATQSPLPIKVRVEGTNELERIEFWKDGQLAHSMPTIGNSASVEWTDPYLVKARFASAYWVRVVQIDGEEAVTSPIWVSSSTNSTAIQ